MKPYFLRYLRNLRLKRVSRNDRPFAALSALARKSAWSQRGHLANWAGRAANDGSTEAFLGDLRPGIDDLPLILLWPVHPFLGFLPGGRSGSAYRWRDEGESPSLGQAARREFEIERQGCHLCEFLLVPGLYGHDGSRSGGIPIDRQRHPARQPAILFG